LLLIYEYSIENNSIENIAYIDYKYRIIKITIEESDLCLYLSNGKKIVI